jgi:hypothetical protein
VFIPETAGTSAGAILSLVPLLTAEEVETGVQFAIKASKNRTEAILGKHLFFIFYSPLKKNSHLILPTGNPCMLNGTVWILCAFEYLFRQVGNLAFLIILQAGGLDIAALPFLLLAANPYILPLTHFKQPAVFTEIDDHRRLGMAELT